LVIPNLPSASSSTFLLARASASDGPRPFAGVTPLNACRKTSVSTPSAAAIRATGRPRSTESVSDPPRNTTVPAGASAINCSLAPELLSPFPGGGGPFPQPEAAITTSVAATTETIFTRYSVFAATMTAMPTFYNAHVLRGRICRPWTEFVRSSYFTAAALAFSSSFAESSGLGVASASSSPMTQRTPPVTEARNRRSVQVPLLWPRFV
jgi:hypothetical protein